MTAPNLNRKLVLETAYRTRDDAGGYTTSWTALGELWAQIRPGSGRDAETAGLPVAHVPCRIMVRGAPAGSPRRPLPGQRLRDGQRIFRVLAVAEADGGARFLTVFAREEEVVA